MIGTNQLSVSEAMGLHEILLTTATMVDKLAFYVDETGDRELESIFSAHLRGFEQTYSELLGFAQGGGTHAAVGAPSYAGRGTVAGGKKASRQTVRPEPNGRIHDRTMVMDCLTVCKSLAVTAITVATEASQTTLRRTLADVSRHQLETSFELYKIAEQRGWYPSLKPQDSPADWLRSTHLPVTGTGIGVETSHIGAAYGAPVYGGAASQGQGAFGGQGYVEPQRDFGTAGYTRTATGAADGSQGRTYGNAPQGAASFAYGDPESIEGFPRR